MDLDLSVQVDMELRYSKYQLNRCIKEEFAEADFYNKFKEQEIDPEFGLNLMIQMVLRKRAKVAVLVGILHRHFETEECPKQACADAILDAIHKDFVDWIDDEETVVIKYDISQDVKDKLDCFQFPLPMVEEPLYVHSNKQTGYRTIHGSLLLKNNHHDDDICLDHINRCNQIPLSIDANVVAFVQNKWKNLDKQKADETWEDFSQRKKQFAKYDKNTRDILAALMALGNEMWLTHKYDFRGRSYSQGYHVNYQGNDWNKAMIQFAETEVLNTA